MSTAATISSPPRRVVKAKAPPPLDPTTTSTATDSADDDVMDNSSGHVTYPLASPSVEREVEQERSEKWRKERHDAAAAKQKQHRDLSTQTRRQSATAASENSASTTTPLPAKVPPEFSVDPKFPEHKRSGVVEPGEEPLGKRRKASIDEPEQDRAETSSTKMMIVSAALAAAVAVGFALFRRSGRG